MAKTESPFFEELDRIIQMATAESRDERTESVRDLFGQIERVIHGLEFQKQIEKTPGPHSASLFSKPKWVWTGIIVAVLSTMLMIVWHLMGEPDLRPEKSAVSTSIGKHQFKSRPGNGTNTETSVAKDESFTSEHLGKQHLIQGGVFTLPDAVDGKSEQSVQVDPFYMDEFFVTNQQFVNFLNHNAERITIESGVVKDGGSNWLLLGEVRSGYEPILYRNNEFHISDPAYASSPVLRVTGYGALAFANYFGRRLPTGLEMLYAMVKGTGNLKANAESLKDSTAQPQDGMMHMMEGWNKETGQWPMENRPEASTRQNSNGTNNNESKASNYLLSAASYAPNLLGVKGLNHEIGEWVCTGQVKSSEEPSKTIQLAVVGGVEGASEDKSSLPAVVERFPWEGFEEIGFRTVKSAASNPSAKPAGTK